jgi:hypothetical protein
LQGHSVEREQLPELLHFVGVGGGDDEEGHKEACNRASAD